MRLRSLRPLALAALAGIGLSMCAPPARALWARMGENVPIPRLINNVQRYVQSHPKDAQGYYVLGRIHSLAFAQEDETAHVMNPKDSELPGFPPYQSVQIRPSEALKLTPKRERHLRESISNYRKAVEIAPNNALYRLGLGWMLEQGAEVAGEVNPPPVSLLPSEKNPPKASLIQRWINDLKSPHEAKREAAVKRLQSSPSALPRLYGALKTSDPAFQKRVKELLRHHWTEAAILQYLKAHRLKKAEDLKRNFGGPEADALISWEAAQNINRLLKTHDTSLLTAAEKRQLVEYTQRPFGISVTPILLPLNGETSLSDLLAPGTRVAFDLSGSGLPARWPWVQPETGILVWDPDGTGQVKSGRQLFGTATWWMFWTDGYHALSSLDDDGSGWLVGRELNGIAVWQDKNANGVSDRGEVRPLSSVKIQAIAVRSDGRRDGVLWREEGVRFEDGNVAPTFDWEPVSLPK